MKVTEQIDALRTLSTDPYEYLVFPRVVAGIVVLPILVGFADVIGIMGGWFVGVQSLDFNGSVYLQNTEIVASLNFSKLFWIYKGSLSNSNFSNFFLELSPYFLDPLSPYIS